MSMSDHNSGLAYLSVLGVCPLLAKATTLLTGITMGLASLCILFFTILSVSSCRRYIVYGFRLPAILLISVTWVTVLDLFMQALCYELRLTLGIYLPLLAMNSFILLSLEQTALTTPSSMALKATLPRGLAILGVLGIIGALRELLGL
ncbi:MAG: electron transport complex protein RnfE, partial [Gammaproteobacteria bacterium]